MHIGAPNGRLLEESKQEIIAMDYRKKWRKMKDIEKINRML